MAAAITYVAQAIGVAFGGSLVIGSIAYVGLYVGVMVGLSKLFAPKIPNLKESLAGKSIMKRSAVEYRKIVYGEAAVSGPIFYNNVSGTDNEYLWYGVALADGEIEDLVSVWFDNDEIPKADIAWTAGIDGADGTGSGNVSTAKWIGSNSTNAVSIYYTLGHANQVAMNNLVAFSDWTTSHRLRGVSYVVARLLYNEDTEEIWRAGHPQNIKAVIRGRKIYDPRKDSTVIIDPTTSPVTYGVGSHDYTDSSTWEWSDNPALCVADYLVNYMNVSAATKIDWPSVAYAANHCKTLVAIPPSASPQTSFEKRFTCNGVISLGASHKDNLHSILSSFDGKLSYVEGQWRVRSSVWEASSVSFDDDDLAGPVEIRGSAPKSERFNTVRGVIADPDRNYEPVEFPIVTNSTYKTRDNNVVITRDLELPMTNNPTMAQRIGFRLLEQSDNQIIAKIKTNARGAKASVGDVVSLTLSKLSWSAKTFRVIEWQRNDDGTFEMTLREDESASYTDPLVAAYTTGNSAYVTVPGNVVPPPVNFSASTVPYGIKLSWTNPASQEFDFIDVYVSSSSAWSGATKVASVRTDTYTFSLGSGETRYFWLRARRNTGDVSLRVPNSDTSTVSGTSGSGADSVQLTGVVLSDKLVTSNDAEVSYRLATTGEEQSYEGDGGTHADIADWLLSGAASSYSCRLTKNSGTDPTGDSLGAWLPLSSTRTWTLTDTVAGGGVISNNCTIAIGDNATSPISVLASATVTMEVEKEEPTVSLSGTTGTPNSASSLAEDPANAESGWRFRVNGSVQRETTAGWGGWATGVEWIDATPPSTYYIRATNYSGTNPTSGTLGSWLALTTEREWVWLRSSVGITQGVLKIEIDTVGDGSNIIATGYYKGFSEVETVA